MTDTQISTLCETATADDIVQKAMLDIGTANRVAEIFKALSDPTRLRMITLLMHHEVCVHVMEEALGMTQSAISHQLRVLRQLNLVRFRKEGRHVFYALDDDHVRILLEQGLMHITHG